MKPECADHDCKIEPDLTSFWRFRECPDCGHKGQFDPWGEKVCRPEDHITWDRIRLN